MPRLSRPLLLSALLLSLAAQTAHAQSSGSFDPDDPRTRAAWNDSWFGVPTPAYLLFKNHAAAAELARWSNTFPLAPGRTRVASLSGPSWANLGPTKSTTNPYSDYAGDIDSGRPVSVVVDPTDPKTVYLATSGGGVWKSTNADTGSSAPWSWSPITDTLPVSSGAGGNVSCGSLAMSPADHQTLFLALGDAFDAAGTGIYKTIDGGTNWTAATITGATPTRSYQVLPVDANIVLVGTDAGLLRSTDGGATFAKIAGSPAGQVWTVQMFDATHLIATSQGTDQGIWYSANAGASWTQATVTYKSGTTAARITVSTSPASTTQAWGEYEDASSGLIERGLLKTTDQGHTWTFVAAPTSSTGLFQAESGDGDQGFYNHCLAVSPTNINDVFLGANLDFYRTTDGGATWQWLSSWDTNNRPYAHADNHCWGWSSDGKLYVGNDGGLAIYLDPLRSTIPTAHDATFLDGTRNQGLITHLCYFLGSTQASNATDAKDRISIGLQDNGTRVRVKDGGTLGASSAFNESIGGDGFGTVWHPTDANRVLGSIYYDQIEKSTDGGASFSSASSGITEANSSANAPFVSHLALGNIATPDMVYAHSNTKVYQSTNFATSWTAMTTTGLPSSYSIRNIGASRKSDAVGIAGNSGRVFLYYPANGAWTGSTSDVTGGAFYTGAVWFDTENDQTVYLTSVAVDSVHHHLFKSINGGASWTPIDTTTNGFPYGVAVHAIQNLPGDSNTLFAGTDFGVYESTNGGASWVRYGAGLPLVATRDLYIAPDKTYIRVATFGRGVWQASLVTTPSVSVSPASATVSVGGTISTFKATASNLAPDTVTWTATAGTFSPTSTAGDGVATTTYTAPASISGVSQSVTVTATGSDATTTGTAAVTVYNPAAVTLTVSPSTAQTVLAGKTVSFTGTTNYGSVTWSASAGSISPVSTASGVAATFTAPAAAGDVTVTAQSAGTASQNVTVHVKTLDVNGDASVDVRDLLALAGAYGTANAAADLNGDGTVDDSDLSLFLANF